MNNKFLIVIGALIFLIGCQQDSPNRILLDQPMKRRSSGLWTPPQTRSKIPAYYERYLPVKGGDWKEDQISFRLAVCDANVDGVYNEPGQDMIFLCPFKNDSVFIRESASQDFINADQCFRVRDHWYAIDSIDARGRWIEFSAIDSSGQQPIIELPDRLPDMEVELLDGKKVEMSSLLQDNKYLYVEVFSTWHQRSFEAAPALKNTFTRYRDSLNIVSLVFNEVEYDRVHKHIKKNDLPWTFAVYTQPLGEAIMITYLPYGALYAPDGRLIKTELKPRQLRYFLDRLF